MGIQSKVLPETILQVDEVTVSFNGFKALKDLNLTVERGELRVLIGPNGAGKTTLLDVITGKVKAQAGRVQFQADGRAPADLSRLSEEQIARLGIGRKFQTPNIFKSLSVWENLVLSAKAGRGVLATLTAAFRHNGYSRAHEILETIGLTQKRHTQAGLLGHGEKQWLELGMVMVQDPELLLIDEPVAGMTPRESERTGELLMAMARKHTLIVIDHDMTFVRQIARQVTVLHEGQILCHGTMQEVQRNPRVIEVYLGQDRQDDAENRKTVHSVR
jgi:urea transport system ATP-binding protein